MKLGFTDLSRDEGEKLEFGWKNLFVTIWREIFTLMRANLCFLLFCIPVITIPPALTALYGICVDGIRGKKCSTMKIFLQTIKTQFFQSLGIVLILAILEAVSIVAARFYFGLECWYGALLGVFTAAIAVIGIIMTHYCFCMLARVNLPMKQILKDAFLLAFLNLKFNICSTVLCIALLLVQILWWLYLLPVILTIGVALITYLSTYFSLYGLQKYVLTEEL